MDNATSDLLPELKQLYRAYVRLLEGGRDRIIELGGSCDPVDVMEAGDPTLRYIRTVIARVEGGATPA